MQAQGNEATVDTNQEIRDGVSKKISGQSSEPIINLVLILSNNFHFKQPSP